MEKASNKMELRYFLSTFFVLQICNSVLASSLSTNIITPSLLPRNSNLFVTSQSASTRRTRLRKRDWHHYTNLFSAVQHLGPGWFLYFDDIDICRTNVDVAASHIVDFYTQVLAVATPVWSSEPPATQHGATLGGLELHFSSVMPIPWEWIQLYLTAAVGLSLGSTWITSSFCPTRLADCSKDYTTSL